MRPAAASVPAPADSCVLERPPLLNAQMSTPGRVGRVNLAYDERGSGDPVLFISGRGGAGRTWHLYQVPAFQRAGYRVVTFDNRGIGATEDAEGFTTEQMVGDTAAIIEKLDAGPVRVVGVSMGSFIAQELMVVRPDLVSAAVLMATGGRHDRTRDFFRTAERDLTGSGAQLPPSYDAKMRLIEGFSPKTLNDDQKVRDWIEMFTMWPVKSTPGLRSQIAIGPTESRLSAYWNITAPVLVIGFADDLVLPPHLGREVAEAIPNARFLQVSDTGHLGFIERPDVVNAAILEFFAAGV